MILPVLFLPVETPTPARAAWQTYLPGQGPPSSTITASAMDSTGALWFGTDRGLVRFDGITWQRHTTIEGLPSDVIRHVDVDPHGRVWVSTTDGAAATSGAGWQHFTTSDGLPANVINTILPLGEDGVYFGTTGGLARLKDGAWTLFQKGDRSPIETPGLWDNRIQALLRTRAGEIWIGENGGYNRLSADGRVTVDDLRNRLDDSITGIAEFVRPEHHREQDQEHPIRAWSILMATATQGLKIYDGTWILTAGPAGASGGVDFEIPTGRLNAVIQDSRRNVWIGGVRGSGPLGPLTRFDGTEWKPFGPDAGFNGNTMNTILEDGSGQLWFGTVVSGLVRFDGELWTTPANPGSSIVTDALCLAEGPDGDIWVGGRGGVDQWDERRWWSWGADRNLPEAPIQACWVDPNSTVILGTAGAGAVFLRPGQFAQPVAIPGTGITAIRRTSDGHLWFGTNTAGLAEWADGAVTRVWGVADSLPSDWIHALAEDADGHLWCATASGIAVFEGGVFHPRPIPGAPGWNVVNDLCAARDGSIWCATSLGAARFRSGVWTFYSDGGAFAIRRLTSVAEDIAGRIWFGTEREGVIRFDGTRFRALRQNDGLAGDIISDVLADRRGRIWFACRTAGVTRHELDHGAPRAVLRTSQAGLGTSRLLRGTFDHAFAERWSVDYSWRVNGGPWYPWSESAAWDFLAVEDGDYLVEVRARDENGNVDRIATRVAFEVDATPPAAVIESPLFGEAVRGHEMVRGSSADPRFRSARVEVRPVGGSSWTQLGVSDRPVRSDVLVDWNTTAFPDGRYELRLEVSDTLSLSGFARIEVVVDNTFPFLDATSPATVRAIDGGDIYSEDGLVHLDIPPRALDRDTQVRIDPIDEAGLVEPAEVVRRWTPVRRVAWSPARLGKPARLGFRLDGIPAETRPRITAQARASDGSWLPLGGTLGAGGVDLSVPISEPLELALFEMDQLEPPSGSARLSDLRVAPRVLDATRGAPRPLALSFNLSEAATFSARIYALNGTLVRLLESGRTLPAGAHVLEWDGRTADGNWPPDGPYLIAIKVNDETVTKSVVVRR